MCSNLVLKTEHTFPRFHCFNQRSCHLLNKQERKPLQKAGLTLFVQAMAVDPHNPFLPRVDACLNHSRARRDKQSSARSWFQDPNQRAMHSPTLNTSHVLGFLLSDWMALLTIETVLHPIRTKVCASWTQNEGKSRSSPVSWWPPLRCAASRRQNR